MDEFPVLGAQETLTICYSSPSSVGCLFFFFPFLAPVLVPRAIDTQPHDRRTALRRTSRYLVSFALPFIHWFRSSTCSWDTSLTSVKSQQVPSVFTMLHRQVEMPKSFQGRPGVRFPVDYLLLGSFRRQCSLLMTVRTIHIFSILLHIFAIESSLLASLLDAR